MFKKTNDNPVNQSLDELSVKKKIDTLESEVTLDVSINIKNFISDNSLLLELMSAGKEEELFNYLESNRNPNVFNQEVDLLWADIILTKKDFFEKKFNENKEQNKIEVSKVTLQKKIDLKFNDLLGKIIKKFLLKLLKSNSFEDVDIYINKLLINKPELRPLVFEVLQNSIKPDSLKDINKYPNIYSVLFESAKMKKIPQKESNSLYVLNLLLFAIFLIALISFLVVFLKNDNISKNKKPNIKANYNFDSNKSELENILNSLEK